MKRTGILAGGNWIVDHVKLIDTWPAQDSLASILGQGDGNGGDLPMRDPRQQLGWVVFSRLSAASKATILGQNALRVFARCLERLPAANRPAPC